MTDEGAREIAAAIRELAHAITPNGLPGRDPFGGTVDSLTEAVMGLSHGLHAIWLAMPDAHNAEER